MLAGGAVEAVPVAVIKMICNLGVIVDGRVY